MFDDKKSNIHNNFSKLSKRQAYGGDTVIIIKKNWSMDDDFKNDSRDT